jgi:branched-chain amino acid transport system substrate-binding protein
MKRTLALVAAAFALLAAGVVLPGCGSSDSSSDTGTSASTGAAPAATTGDTSGGGSDKSPYKIASLITKTGTFASSDGPGALGLQAWADSVNANGGINGHPVELDIKDDQNNPSVALSAIKQIVADKSVIALVGSVSAVEEAWAPVAKAAGLPVVGDFPFTPVSYSTEYVFPQGTTAPSVYYGQVYSAIKLAKQSKLSVFYCAEEPSCATSAPVLAKEAESLGGSLVNKQGIPATAPNFDAQCTAAQKSGATAIIMLLGSGTISSVAQSCASVGYKPQYIIQTTALTPEQTKVAAMDDATYGVVQTFPWTGDETPAQKQFQEGVKAANVPSDKLGAAVSLAWTGGALFEAAAKTITGDATRESVADALWSLPAGETLDGLAPPLTFARDKPSPEQKCFFVMKLTGGAWTAPYGSTKTFCQP